MKILLYSANFAPEPVGVGKYSGEMAAWLVRQGHQVRVVAAPPYYPAWRLDPAYARPLFKRELWHGVEIFRAPLWVPSTPGGLARLAHLASFVMCSFPVMLRQVVWRPDLVLTVAPAFLCAPIALLVARLVAARSWLHLQDFEVDLAFRMGLLKGKLLQRIALRMERSLLRRFDTVSSISGRMLELLLTKGVSQDRTCYLPNWVDIDHITPLSARSTYRRELGIKQNAIVVLFSGSLAGKQDLELIPAVARLVVARRDIVFILCGEGVMKPRLQRAAQGLPNVHFLPLQPFERLGELLSTADIHLLPQSPDAADLVLPSKLSGMLASGRPVITMGRTGTELATIVETCGVVVAPGDQAAFAAALCALADDGKLRSTLGRRARSYAEMHFERDTILDRVFGPGDVPEPAAPLANSAAANSS
jgi:colanic acid biosynthesis glycosyl transferase WcaI